MSEYVSGIMVDCLLYLEGALPSFAVPYFASHKTEFFSFQNNPKNLDQSYKTDLDL